MVCWPWGKSREQDGKKSEKLSKVRKKKSHRRLYLWAKTKTQRVKEWMESHLCFDGIKGIENFLQPGIGRTNLREEERGKSYTWHIWIYKYQENHLRCGALVKTLTFRKTPTTAKPSGLFTASPKFGYLVFQCTRWSWGQKKPKRDLKKRVVKKRWDIIEVRGETICGGMTHSGRRWERENAIAAISKEKFPRFLRSEYLQERVGVVRLFKE